MAIPPLLYMSDGAPCFSSPLKLISSPKGPAYAMQITIRGGQKVRHKGYSSEQQPQVFFSTLTNAHCTSIREEDRIHLEIHCETGSSVNHDRGIFYITRVVNSDPPLPPVFHFWKIG